jgi:hypothetical protein
MVKTMVPKDDGRRVYPEELQLHHRRCSIRTTCLGVISVIRNIHLP